MQEISTPPAAPQESMYAFVGRHAAGASTRALLALLLLPLAAGVTLLAVSVWLWPFAALGGAAATTALWGLLAHRAERHSNRITRLLQAVLTGLGTLLVLAAVIAVFFWALGPRWNL